VDSGWRQDMYFLDHNSGTTTYDDPRYICAEPVTSSAERIAERETTASTEPAIEATLAEGNPAPAAAAAPSTATTTAWKASAGLLSACHCHLFLR
jgi:hypothetical protein